MAAANVNVQRKNAMRRLMKDLQELDKNPVDNVSAKPLEDDMFEWHCNLLLDDVVHHLILFFPENYPFVSPCAEFMPPGFRFPQGASMKGKKGEKICLSIFSDYAYIHKEWKDEKGVGWSPGYTTQTVLLNVVSFLHESNDASNAARSKKFSCEDCGHSYDKPWPPLGLPAAAEPRPGPSGEGASGGAREINNIVCYISKQSFEDKAPANRDDVFGFGLQRTGSQWRPEFKSPCEFVSGSGFFNMLEVEGKVHSVMKEKVDYFLPLYISIRHGDNMKEYFEQTLGAMSRKEKFCSNVEDAIFQILPNVMNTTVVSFYKGDTFTSDNSLIGYFLFHRLLLWATKEYPKLKKRIEEAIEDFVSAEECRLKTNCPNLGHWLMMLSATKKYSWRTVYPAYMGKCRRRNVMWYVKEDEKLGFLDTDQEYRLTNTFLRTEVSRKLLAFQVSFLDIAMPENLTLDEITARYDENMGFPTQEMVVSMKEACEKINKCDSYKKWFNSLHLRKPSDEVLYKDITDAVEFAINSQDYKWTHKKNAGGWKAVLRKYPDGTPGYQPRTPASFKEYRDRKRSASHEEDGPSAKAMDLLEAAVAAEAAGGAEAAD